MARRSALLDAEKPYLELYDGFEIPKAAALMRHGMLQLRMGMLLVECLGDRGAVGTEARVWLDDRTSLVPDVAFITRERYAGLAHEQRQYPPFAPDIAVEIRSPSDRPRNIARKIELYLAHGARLVLDVDPAKRAIHAWDAQGVRTYRAGTFEYPMVPDLSFDVEAFFASGETT